MTIVGGGENISVSVAGRALPTAPQLQKHVPDLQQGIASRASSAAGRAAESLIWF